jgi:hypothetical protein
MPPYVTLGLVARKHYRGPEQPKGIPISSTQGGRIRLPDWDATPNPLDRQGRWVAAARNQTAGRSCLAAQAAIGTARASVRRECHTNGTSWWIGIRAETLNGTARLRRLVYPKPAVSSTAGVNEVGVKYIPSAMFIVPLNISRFSSQVILSASDRGLGQILAECAPNCKLSEISCATFWILSFSNNRLSFPGRHADFQLAGAVTSSG